MDNYELGRMRALCQKQPLSELVIKAAMIRLLTFHYFFLCLLIAINRLSFSYRNNFDLLELAGISLFHKSNIRNNRLSKALGELCKIHIHNTTGKRWLAFLQFY
jgi:hypothetical protein